MKSTDIIILIATLTIVAIRLYQKYQKKNGQESTKSGKGNDIFKKNTLANQSDDYEPYSNKRSR